MTAACLKHLYGRAVYDDLMAATRAKVEQPRANGTDKPLIFPNWDAPTAADRSVVNDKGALFVHELRQTMGNDAFWRGLRRYTTANWGRSVRSADFEAAMQAESAVSLQGMFGAWVWGEGKPMVP